MIMIGCNTRQQPDKQTEEICKKQIAYYNLLKLQHNATIGVPQKANRIQQEEYCDSVFKAVRQFTIDNPFFINWIGTIKNINIHKGYRYSSIDFDIAVTAPDSVVKITFECRNIIDNDSIEMFPLYNDVKDLAENSKIYFTGFLGDDVLPNSLCKEIVPYDINEPFDIIDISSKPLKDDISKNIIDCFNLICKFKELLKTDAKISASESDNMQKQFLNIQSKFSDQEKETWSRFEYAIGNASNREYGFLKVE